MLAAPFQIGIFALLALAFLFGFSALSLLLPP
jgi:hypothetical protein